MHSDLSAKRVIVTGASRGIGAAIAKAFAREGVRLAICARNPEAIGAIGREAELLGAKSVISSTVDVRETGQVRAWINKIAAAWGGVDVLVNNAGQGRGGNIDTLQPEVIIELANVILMTQLRCALA